MVLPDEPMLLHAARVRLIPRIIPSDVNRASMIIPSWVVNVGDGLFLQSLFVRSDNNYAVLTGLDVGSRRKSALVGKIAGGIISPCNRAGGEIRIAPWPRRIDGVCDLFGLVVRILGDREVAEEVPLSVYSQIWRQARSTELLGLGHDLVTQ
jgi:hypothetical protein